MNTAFLLRGSRDSSVSIATRYGLEGPGIESRCGEIFRTYPDQLRGPPSLLYNGYRVSPGCKSGRCVMLNTHPLLVPRLRKSWAIPPLTLWVLLGLSWGSLFISTTKKMWNLFREIIGVCRHINKRREQNSLSSYVRVDGTVQQQPRFEVSWNAIVRDIPTAKSRVKIVLVKSNKPAVSIVWNQAIFLSTKKPLEAESSYFHVFHY